MMFLFYGLNWNSVPITAISAVPFRATVRHITNVEPEVFQLRQRFISGNFPDKNFTLTAKNEFTFAN